MTPKQRIKHGNDLHFDASDEWWEGDPKNPPVPTDAAHAAARGVISDLQDRRSIKRGFDDIGEEIRKEIVESLAAIIREAMG